jgi:hypothetical protein
MISRKLLKYKLYKIYIFLNLVNWLVVLDLLKFVWLKILILGGKLKFVE